MKYKNNDFITALCWMYGFTKKEAREYIKKADYETLESVYLCYMNEMNKAFYND